MKIHEVTLPVLFIKEDKKFVAYTPALDISTCGNTFEKAKQRFEEMVDVFFEEASRMGTLEDILIESGWRKKGKHRDALVPPRFVTQIEEKFKVPCQK